MIYHESIAPKMFIAVHAQLSNSCFPKGGERSAHMTHQFFSSAAVSPLRIASMFRRRWSCFLTYTACSRIHTWPRIWPTGTDNTHAYLWTTQITGTRSISFPEPRSSEWWLWKRNCYRPEVLPRGSIWGKGTSCACVAQKWITLQNAFEITFQACNYC